ncbi:MAG: hypothetical protein KH405_02610 [Firmicutes bacterium]|nr:hypothetical protein [Bacillota bacterium]
MKNQVNKKVSKLLIALLSLVIMSVACVSLAACNKECTHSKFKLSEDTATCVAGGFITHTCEDCGYAYMEPTPAKGHDYGTAEVVPATCTTDGYTVKTCKTCGFEEKSDVTKATGHLHTSEVVVAATCITNGSKKVVCQDCGTVVSEETLLATGHAYVDEAVAATCGADGYTLRTCATCGDIQYVKGAPATGNHNYVEVSRIDATCKTAGTVLERCTVCDKEKTTLLPVSDVHTFGDITNVSATCQEAAHREQTCKICGYVEKTDFTGDIAPHAYSLISETKATCTSKGVTVQECDVCGKKQITETDKLAHTYGEEATIVAATCENEGSKYYTCEVCGHKDVIETYEKLGHDFSEVAAEVPATCTAAGFKTMMCSRCGKNGATTVLNKLDHEYDEAKKVVVAATCTAGGYTMETCKLCGNQFTTETTEAAGHDWETTRRTEATCTADGQVLSTCKACSATKIDVLEATGHQYTDMVKEATCTEGAMAYQLCTVCGATTEYVPVEGSVATGHNFEVVVGATCQDNGYEVCANCGEKHTLDKIDHTYAIADSVYEKVDINVYFAEGGKYAYLPEYAKENILAIYEGIKEDSEKLNEYCTITAATCTEGGSIKKICDMCKVRYTDGNTSALGHNFGDAQVSHDATCYAEGYTAWECSRCHYQAGATAADIKSAVQPILAHCMTIDNGAGEKKIYAKYVAGVLTYYEDATCTTELTIAQCNVLYKNGDEKFVYYCDVCGAMADAENKVATGTYATAGESAFTGRYEKLGGVTLKVYATTEIKADAGRLAAAAHDFENVPAVIDHDELIMCGYVSKSIIACKNCHGAAGDYADYNLTEAKPTEETYVRPGATVGEVVTVTKYDTTYTEHYEMYSYRMYYHEAVEIAESAACVTPTKYVYTCGRHAIPNVQAECSYYLDITGLSYLNITEDHPDKCLPKAVVTDDIATYTMVEKATAGYIKACADAYLAALTEAGETEKADEFAAREYDVLWDETFEEDKYNVFVAKDPAGHKFETEYVIVSFTENEDGTFKYSDRACNAAKLIVLTKCSVCGKYNYINDANNTDGIGATDKIQNNGENDKLVNNANAIVNVAHGVAVTDEHGNLVVENGKFTWANVAYVNEFNVSCGADDAGAVAYAYNPSACADDCAETHTHIKKCDAFTCATCAENVLTHHVYDVATSDCYHSQNCVCCGIQIKGISHKEPDITCYSAVSNDGYYHCTVCDAPIKLLTPHNVVITIVSEATCTEKGLWTAKCSICDLAITKEYLEAQTAAGIAVKVTGLEAGNTTNAAYLAGHTVTVDPDGVATITAAMLEDAALGHAWATDFTIDTPATCTTVGSKSKHCTRCEEVSEVTEIPALRHNFVADLTALEALTPEQITALYGADFVALKAATCKEDGYYYLICQNGCGKYKNEAGEAVALEDAKLIIDKATVAHTWGAYQLVEAATCVNKGSEKRTCEVCGKEETRDIAALGHNFSLEIVKVDAEGAPVKADCTLGYVVKAFKCAHEGCDIDSKYIYEEGTDMPKAVIYQRDVAKYLTDKGIAMTKDVDKDGKLEATGAYDGNFYYTTAKNGLLDFEETEHVLTTFDMDPGHLIYELNEFVAPSYGEDGSEVLGSAYWLCENCGARVYRKNSVSFEQYNYPSVNTDWQAKVAPSITEIKVTGSIALDTVLTKNVYFNSTPTGFEFKDDAKLDEVVGMIYNKLHEKLAAETTHMIVSINGSANTTLDFTNEADVKTALKTLLTAATITTEINVTIA